jgi:phosphomannomutase
VRDLFTRVFRKLACRLLVIETPTRGRASLDPTDPDLERVSRRIHEIRPHLGVLADEDGERCSFFDEQGRFVPPSLMARVLAADFNDAPGRPNPESASNAARGGSALGTSREAITSAMLTGQLPFAADGTGRYWFREAYPACDALLTLVHLLQVLSRSDRPFSEVVARA